MGTISLLTHSFLDGYNRRYDRVFGGGLERYVGDLCEVVRDLGERPEVHQLSYYEPFRTTWNGIDVYGHSYEFDRVPDAFDEMARQANGRLVYASCIWHPIRYAPGSMGICHGINWDSPLLPRQSKAAVADAIQSAIDRLDPIVSVDSHFQTYCRSVCSYEDANRIVVIPNAVDTSAFVPRSASAATDRKLRVLFPRRLSLERGLVPMMRVTDLLLSRRDDVEVEFAGETVQGSPAAEAFEAWLQVHPARRSILHRTYDFDQIREAYAAADIVVIPTVFSEGTSYACLEAMSCGLPIVSTNVGGLNDLLIDGHNGLLVPPTSDAILNAVRRLVDDGGLRQALGANARLSATAFDKRIWRSRWRDVLETFMRGR
ncbi:glycosyltransferase family 4 protein [Cohnella sp. GCM10027633]|uniref:glycosyltransferase family 4 protein n=1 Tax=unclassified Cohnella TaxID=2636738 RepID=UPI0036337169